MNNDITSTYEYTVEQKPEGKFKTRRVLLMILYILYPLFLMVIVSLLQIFQLFGKIPSADERRGWRLSDRDPHAPP